MKEQITTFSHHVTDIDPIVSYVLPCLNERETIGQCIAQIYEVINELQLPAEIIVADNGSTDGSDQIANRAGARVLPVATKGYGSALLSGCKQARGQYIVMGDADESYDFHESIGMVRQLAAGYDIVLGSRFAGNIKSGAMPWKNQYIGNPALTGLLNLFYRSGFSDAHCGLRAFTKDAFERMDLRCLGMEFASEMVVKAALLKLKRAEIPITYHPDGRNRAPHLNPWRDGWRHLRFLLLYSPSWVYLQPGLFFLFFGILLNTILVILPESDFFVLGSLFLGTHWTIPATLAAASGLQMILLGTSMHIYAAQKGFFPLPSWLNRYGNLFSLEKGLLLGGGIAFLGFCIEIGILWVWIRSGFDSLSAFRLAMFGLMWILLGMTLFLNSFFLSLLVDEISSTSAPAENTWSIDDKA